MRFAVLFVLVLILAACDNMPGRPGPPEGAARPEQVRDFGVLYQQNCAGCHGAEGKGGASIALKNSVYLAIADDAVLRTVTSDGVPGTQMPAFAQNKGGTLTGEQIGILVAGIRVWAGSGTPGDGLPQYAAQTAGDPVRGAGVYEVFCSSCHGAGGRGGKGGSAIANATYLSLVSDQYLRTVIISGRPELGAPDYRGNVPGKPMSAQEISDVAAWLASQRPQSQAVKR
ncbi:MAG: c-type cytochrome [Bryobacteraceae bacterium]